MKEFIISEVKSETAVLVGLITPTQDERKTKEYLDELEFSVQENWRKSGIISRLKKRQNVRLVW